MIGYVCKYSPVELLEAMGAEPACLEPEVTEFNQADTLMHPNVCSYAKSVLEAMAQKPYEGIVLTTCCDSIRRLYDTLKNRYPDRFIWLLDVPRKTTDYTVGVYADRLLEMCEAYAAFSGKPYHPDRLRAKLAAMREKQPLREDRCGGAQILNLGILGARAPQSLYRMLDRKDVHILFDLTCTGMDRARALLGQGDLPEEILRPSPDGGRPCGLPSQTQASGRQGPEPACPDGDLQHPLPYDRQLLLGYSSLLLSQIPCLRMTDQTARRTFLSEKEKILDGVIYHTVKFCDSYSFEYAEYHREGEVPLLKLETDLTAQCEGQIRTRVEAFLESLHTLKYGDKEESRAAAGGETSAAKAEKERAGQNLSEIRVMGVDSGSTSTNAVIMDGNRKILSSGSIRTGAKTSESSERIMAQVLEKAGLCKEDLALIISTGYGRVSIPYADRNVTEISCHAKGARYFNPKVRTILDIGGQDSKAIRMNDEGEVIDFVMNDKCAAGTGRFLEAMARTLEVDISELGPISMKSTEEVGISSMCTVFAESEVISLIAQNKEKADIARGVHRAIAGKACSLLNRVDPVPEFMMTGGVARNPGVVKAVEEKMGAPFYLCEDPDIVGAAGAALYALEAVEKGGTV
jgi:predicted CoA-substrate-specific enzyme activase